MTTPDSCSPARKGGNDDLRTKLSVIENELKYYRDHFKGKVVFCNCDDPYESNFFKYFIQKFNHLGLKKLITTCYAGSPVAGTELDLVERGVAYKIEVSDIGDSDGFSLDKVKQFLKSDSPKKKIEKLEGDGDFRSKECIELLKEADIVITYPPPSLFGQYVDQLLKYKKDFIILGRHFASTSRAIFPLIKGNKLWVGASISNGYISFDLPASGSMDKEPCTETPVLWFTSLDHGKRHEDMVLYETYSPEKYPKYDNYDAINVDKVTEIPCDYDGVMGVPLTFLSKYNPGQFEILGCTEIKDEIYCPQKACPTVNGKNVFVRVFIRKKR